MIRKFIGVKLAVEGFHNFPNAAEVFDKRIDFLEVRHRHNFHIEMEAEVQHNERDKEFILLQREVKEFLYKKYGNPCEFGSLSCESIAEILMNRFDAESVKVSEDDENYAKIIKYE